MDGLGKQLVGFSKEISNLRFVSPKVEVLKAGVGGAALGAGLGFVFSAAGVLIFDKTDERWKHAAVEGARGALVGGVGGAAGGVAGRV